ncbi:MAG: Fe-S oxidoreductase, partial [Candidatus Nanopelagicaceae bacterium]
MSTGINPDPLGLFPNALALIAYLLTIIGVALFAWRAKELVTRIRRGQKDPTRSGDRSLRLKRTFAEIFGHTKMLNFTASGIAHWFVMIGFVALSGTLLTAYGQTISPDFYLPVIGHFVGYELFVDAIAWLTGIGIVTLILIRQVTRVVNRGRNSRFYGSGQGKAYFVEFVILAIVFCVITLRGLEGALLGID